MTLIAFAITVAAVVQLVRIPACHAGGRGFEPRPLRHPKMRGLDSWDLSFQDTKTIFLVGLASFKTTLLFFSGRLAQLVERLPYKQNVGGSIPSAPTISSCFNSIYSLESDSIIKILRFHDYEKSLTAQSRDQIPKNCFRSSTAL